MATAVISMEAVCGIVLLTILYGCIFEVRTKSKTARQYAICVIAVILALAVDLLSRVCERTGGCGDALLFALKLPALAIRPWIAVCFLGYLLVVINNKKNVTYWYVYAAVIFNACGTVFLFIGAFLGKVFAVVNGEYLPGAWYMLSRYCAVATMAYIAIIALRCRKILGLHDMLAVVFYLLIPALAMVPEDFFPGFFPSYVAVALSLVVIYVAIQAREMNAGCEKAQSVHEDSNVDALTGLMNRRAYDEKLLSTRAVKYVGVVFADLNGLKFVNEHFGHPAGDELLVSFAGMLGRHFRQEDCFRISGDEFVVILDGIADGGFFQRVKELRAENESKNEIAAIGIMHGSGAETLDLIHKAEREMHEEKKAFYRANPQYFRQ